VNGTCRWAGCIQVPPLSRDSDQTPPLALPGSCRYDVQWSCQWVVNRQQIDHENSITGYTFSKPVTAVNQLTGFVVNRFTGLPLNKASHTANRWMTVKQLQWPRVVPSHWLNHDLLPATSAADIRFLQQETIRRVWRQKYWDKKTGIGTDTEASIGRYRWVSANNRYLTPVSV